MIHGDSVEALADLVGRAGAGALEIAWSCPHTPDEPPGHQCDRVVWSAQANYRGARIITAEHRSPSAACLALSERLLSGATCRCRRPVTLDDTRPGCRWQLMGKRWEPGCDAEPIKVSGQRGDLQAMRKAMAQPRKKNKRRGKGGRRG